MVGLLVGLVVGLAFGLAFGLQGGLLIGLLVGLVFGLVAGLTPLGTSVPSAGTGRIGRPRLQRVFTQRSLKFGLVVWLAIGLTRWLFALFNSEPVPEGAVSQLVTWLAGGLSLLSAQLRVRHRRGLQRSHFVIPADADACAHSRRYAGQFGSRCPPRRARPNGLFCTLPVDGHLRGVASAGCVSAARHRRGGQSGAATSLVPLGATGVREYPRRRVRAMLPQRCPALFTAAGSLRSVRRRPMIRTAGPASAGRLRASGTSPRCTSPIACRWPCRWRFPG